MYSNNCLQNKININILRLMSELIDVMLFFLSLNGFNVCEHVAFREILGEFFRLKRIQVEASKRNELPCISESTEIAAERLDLRVSHSERRPIERR